MAKNTYKLSAEIDETANLALRKLAVTIKKPGDYTAVLQRALHLLQVVAEAIEDGGQVVIISRAGERKAIEIAE